MSINRIVPTTRMPKGVTNAAPWQTLANAGFLDPSWAHVFFDDFDPYVAATYTISGTGGAVAAIAGRGGLVSATTPATSGNAVVIQRATATFSTQNTTTVFGNRVTAQVFFKIALWNTVVNASGTIITGIADSMTAPNNGYTIQRNSSGVWSLNVYSASGTALATATLPTVTETLYQASQTTGQPFELGIYVNEIGDIGAFVNPTTGSIGGSGNTPNTFITSPGSTGRGALAVIPATAYTPIAVQTTYLAPGFSYTNTATQAGGIDIDYILAAQDR